MEKSWKIENYVTLYFFCGRVFGLNNFFCQFSKKSKKVGLEKGLFYNASPEMTVIFFVAGFFFFFSFDVFQNWSCWPTTTYKVLKFYEYSFSSVEAEAK
jgi:hypothetical protein